MDAWAVLERLDLAAALPSSIASHLQQGEAYRQREMVCVCVRACVRVCVYMCVCTCVCVCRVCECFCVLGFQTIQWKKTMTLFCTAMSVESQASKGEKESADAVNIRHVLLGTNSTALDACEAAGSFADLA